MRDKRKDTPRFKCPYFSLYLSFKLYFDSLKGHILKFSFCETEEDIDERN